MNLKLIKVIKVDFEGVFRSYNYWIWVQVVDLYYRSLIFCIGFKKQGRFRYEGLNLQWSKEVYEEIEEKIEELLNGIVTKEHKLDSQDHISYMSMYEENITTEVLYHFYNFISFLCSISLKHVYRCGIP